MSAAPRSLPVLECRLDAAGLREQLDRYRELGRHTEGAEREAQRASRRLSVSVAHEHQDPALDAIRAALSPV